MDFHDEEFVVLRAGRGGEGGDGRGEDGEEEGWKHFVGWVVAFGRECEGLERGEGGWWRLRLLDLEKEMQRFCEGESFVSPVMHVKCIRSKGFLCVDDSSSHVSAGKNVSARNSCARSLSTLILMESICFKNLAQQLILYFIVLKCDFQT